MAPELLWLGAAIAGYCLAMLCNPLRGFFADGFSLLRERGRLRLWLPVAVLSLAPLSPAWFAKDGGGSVDRDSRRALELARSVAADGAALFSGAAGLRPAPQTRHFAAKTRAALSIGAIFLTALVIGQQFFVLTALYLGAVIPERDPGIRGLFDFAWRRLARFWPGLLVAAAFTIVAFWLPPEGAASVLIWPFAAAVAAGFAFLQVALLSGERGWGDALRTNFVCWARLPYFVFWFLLLAALHLFLLHLTDAILAARISHSPILTIGWDIGFALIRAGVMVWLLAAWVLLFCAKTKNPSRRRIRP